MTNACILAAGFAAMFVLGYWARGPRHPRHPAGGSGPAPVPARTHPPASPPAGAAPAQAVQWPASPPPGPGSTLVSHISYLEADCHCFEIINHIHGTRRIDRCTRHAFAAHWNERLRQS